MSVNRRKFLKTSAAGATALTLAASSYARDQRRQRRRPHRLPRRRRPLPAAHRRHPANAEEKTSRRPRRRLRRLGRRREARQAKQGTAASTPRPRRCGIDVDDKNHVTKDYRKILDQKDVDVDRRRHAGPLARPHGHRRAWTPARTSTGKADDAHHRRGASPSSMRLRKNNRVMTVGVQSMADPTWLAANEYITARQDRPRPAGTDQLLPQLQRRPVALLSAEEGHDAEDDRLGHVAGPQVRRRRRQARADRRRRCRSTGPCGRSGAATGRSAAACSPTCSSTRRRT